MAMSPGTYLRKRREAADLTIDDVATMLPTEPHSPALSRAEWLTQIEADVQPIGNDVVGALRYVFAFDASVLRRLQDLRACPGLPEPRLCRKCACSAFDPCHTNGPLGRGTCMWVEEDLCSACPPEGEPGVAAIAPDTRAAA
jgi:hypothetical protein